MWMNAVPFASSLSFKTSVLIPEESWMLLLLPITPISIYHKLTLLTNKNHCVPRFAFRKLCDYAMLCACGSNEVLCFSPLEIFHHFHSLDKICFPDSVCCRLLWAVWQQNTWQTTLILKDKMQRLASFSVLGGKKKKSISFAEYARESTHLILQWVKWNNLFIQTLK